MSKRSIRNFFDKVVPTRNNSSAVVVIDEDELPAPANPETPTPGPKRCGKYDTLEKHLTNLKR